MGMGEPFLNYDNMIKALFIIKDPEGIAIGHRKITISTAGIIPKLKQYIDGAYAKPAGARNKFDKEIIKVDERLNICFMIYSGEFMKIFPVKDQSLKWHSPKDAYKFVSGSEDSLYLRNIVSLYIMLEIL